MKLLGSALAFWRIISEISIDEIQKMADREFTILVTGPSSDDCSSLVSCLHGVQPPIAASGQDFKQVVWPVPPDQARSLTRCDVFVYVAGWDHHIPEADLDDLRSVVKGLTPLVVVRHGVTSPLLPAIRDKGPAGVFKKTVVVDRLEPVSIAGQVIPAIVDFLPDHAVALGRMFPPFRQAAAARVIQEASRTNAQFAAISNLPAMIPVVGNLIAATADLLVLTRNQIMMLLKLAAIFGRDVKSQRSIIREIVPVVGAAFLWRTVARELADLLPALLAAIPKIVVAFTGTYAVGQAAAFYYSQGRKPSATALREYYATAIGRASMLPAVPQIGSKTRRTSPH